MAGISLTIPQILTPRLKTPMIRRQRGGKLEPVSWDEALNYVAERLSAIKESADPMPCRRPAPRVVRVTKPTM
ncbi:molybdopterin-dependent oxidoreductase [Escherichia coli]